MRFLQSMSKLIQPPEKPVVISYSCLGEPTIVVQLCLPLCGCIFSGVLVFRPCRGEGQGEREGKGGGEGGGEGEFIALSQTSGTSNIKRMQLHAEEDAPLRPLRKTRKCEKLQCMR